MKYLKIIIINIIIFILLFPLGFYALKKVISLKNIEIVQDHQKADFQIQPVDLSCAMN